MSNPVPYRVGEWLPSDQEFLDSWLAERLAIAKAESKALHPKIQEFQEFIEGDPAVYMLFNQMFTQVHHLLNPASQPQVQDYQEMLVLLNHIMTTAPEFNETGLVGFPINAIFDWSMGTTSGYAAFLREDVNRHLKVVLDSWGEFLISPASVNTLNDSPTGWLSDAAFKAMAPEGTADPKQYFQETFDCQPDDRHYGFASWDEFFTRRFRDCARPIASPGDDSVIANACESAPYALHFDVQRESKFWIKGQPYALDYMLGHDEWVADFVGGTIYQAFLSAKSYHCWNSPVKGTIAKIKMIQGTYYSESLLNRHDPAGPNDSQGYITTVATRALIFIEADDPNVGLMCFMPVGMAEVSSCEVIIKENQRVEKGQLIGMFHFGGSTHCLFFRPGVHLAWDLHGQMPSLNSSNIDVNSKIAQVCDEETARVWREIYTLGQAT